MAMDALADLQRQAEELRKDLDDRPERDGRNWPQRRAEWLDLAHDRMESVFELDTLRGMRDLFDPNRRPRQIEASSESSLSEIRSALYRAISEEHEGLRRVIARAQSCEPRIHDLLLPDSVALHDALRRFRDASRRLERGRSPKPGHGLEARARYPLKDEYDVQDALWLYLRMTYADADDEDATPNLGGAGVRLDFYIRSIATAVEVKYLRADTDLPMIRKDLIVKIAGARQREDIRKLVVFVAEANGTTAAPLDDLSRESTNTLKVMIARVAL